MKNTTLLAIALTTFAILPATETPAATRIQFARGSYCGSYSGNFSRGREFVLRLRGGQILSTRNIGRGTQYNIYVNGPTGTIDGRPVSPNQIDYPIPRSGDYYIYIESSTPYSNIEFCAR
ncbi:hypothetical protein V0288_15215 [Pannus brasiliensis CCIBt3594]|uniref:Peptidase C-terminal archaeal/bacterial domain-containing protein n=1 Tax=Pannus brasiliensis CCIBt3594 TaxID=1427578 RepID=A0AAW9QL08_9CHRO